MELCGGDLVVMDIETYNRREKMLKLHEELLAVKEDRMCGSKGHSVDEVAEMMRSVIMEENIKEAGGRTTLWQESDIKLETLSYETLETGEALEMNLE